MRSGEFPEAFRVREIRVSVVENCGYRTVAASSYVPTVRAVRGSEMSRLDGDNYVVHLSRERTRRGHKRRKDSRLTSLDVSIGTHGAVHLSLIGQTYRHQISQVASLTPNKLYDVPTEQRRSVYRHLISQIYSQDGIIEAKQVSKAERSDGTVSRTAHLFRGPAMRCPPCPSHLSHYTDALLAHQLGTSLRGGDDNGVILQTDLQLIRLNSSG